MSLPSRVSFHVGLAGSAWCAGTHVPRQSLLLPRIGRLTITWLLSLVLWCTPLLASLGPRAPAAQAASPIVETQAGDAPQTLQRDNVPQAVQRDVTSQTWQRITEQLHADQQATSYGPCVEGPFVGPTRLASSDGDIHDEFGQAVAINRDTLVVGAWRADIGGSVNQGAAYVFARNQGGADHWGQLRKLTASDGAANDQFGSSVSIDGDTIVVGDSYADIGGNANQGAAYIFARNLGGADNWGEVRKLTAADGAAEDWLGYSVAISGDTLIVGSEQDDDLGDDCGSAYVFARNQGGADNWGEVRKLTASDGAAEDAFGYSVAISGDTLAVGARGADVSGRVDQGAAYVYTRNQGGADHWGEVRKLTAADGAARDGFGHSVAICGDTLVVGAPGAEVAGGPRGAAYMFARNQGGSDNWGEFKKLTLTQEANSYALGLSVSLHGDTLVVGAPIPVFRGMPSCAYVFARNRGGADNWGQAGKLPSYDSSSVGLEPRSVAVYGDTLVVGSPYAQYFRGFAYVFTAACTPDSELKQQTASDGGAGDLFGYSAALSDDTLVVGAYGKTIDGHPSQGAACVLARNRGGLDNWGQVQRLTASDGDTSDTFGCAVAISGDTLVVGAEGADDVRGAAYVFARNYDPANPATPLADSWGQVKKLSASDPAILNKFGCAVTIDGDTIVVGSFHDSVDGKTEQGSAYVFARNQGGADNWGEVKKITAADGAADDDFSCSVSLSGDTLIVGADGDDDLGSRSGSAYVLARNYDPNNPTIPLADNWGQVKKLAASDGSPYDQFGGAVSICGDTLAVGASWEDTNGAYAGAVYTFARNQGGADQWGEVTKLLASDGAEGDLFGTAVAIDGDTLLVGAPRDSEQGASTGSAYLFERNLGGADHWGQAAKLTAPDGAADDNFGGAAALSGDMIAIGALGDDDLGEQSGSVYLYACAAPPAPSDLSIAKQVEPQVLRRGDVLTYTLTYTNDGPMPASEVYLRDTLPAGLTYAGVASAPPGWCNLLYVGTQLLRWYTRTLDAGATASFVIRANVNLPVALSPDWVLTNTAQITATTDITPTNNVTTTSNILQGLQIAKSHRPEHVTAQWNFSYDIDVTNTASSPATSLLITDTLPLEVASYSVLPSAGGTFDGVRTVTWNVGTLGPGVTLRVSVKAQTFSNAAGQCITNVAVADSAQAAPPVTATDTLCVLAPQPVTPTPTPTVTPTGIPPCADPYEPNDSLAQALTLTPGRFQPFICCRAPELPLDVDWYAFRVVAGSTIQVSISDLPADYNLCLVAPDHMTVTCSSNPTTTAEYIEHVAARTGEYYAYVYGVQGACDCLRPYTLELAITPAQPMPTPDATLTPTPTATATPAGDLRLTGHIYQTALRKALQRSAASNPVANAQVSVLVCVPRRFETTTDADGAYSLLLPGGYLEPCAQVTFEVSAAGYVTWTETLSVADLRAHAVRDVTLTRVEQATPTATPTSSTTPSPTSTPTHTPSPTPTPRIYWLHLPIILY